MITLELARAEQVHLRELLESAISDLGMEIAATDSQDFREGLKARRESLRRILAALEPSASEKTPDPSA